MSNALSVDAEQWYAVHTKPREEDRADSNLRAWRVETLSPKIKEVRYNQFTGRPTTFIKPLFSRYIFARFDADKLLHKVYYTRGVHSVVNICGSPIPVDDEAIEIIKTRVEEDGFVHFAEEFTPGDKVTIKDGPFMNLNGIFDRAVKDSDRVMILLTSVNFRASVTLGRNQVRKTELAACSV